MATTTNYGWTTPDDTALVKDGAAAIRTLGSSVDTTTKALNPSTTLGDIEYRSSTANTNTRLGIGSTGQVLSVSGGVPAWTTPAGGGKVLQVVSAVSTTSTTISTATFTDTTLTASITPTSATSKILVICSQNQYLSRAGVNIFASGRIMRGATSIYELGYIGGFGVPNATGTIEFFTHWTPVYLDSPATTSSTTYKTQQALNAASGSIIAQFASNPSTITLLEIGA